MDKLSLIVRSISTLFLLLLSPFSAASQKVNIVTFPDSQFVRDSQKLYYQSLLARIFIATEQKYGSYHLEPVQIPMLQKRALASLDTNLLDIAWTMTSAERELNYLPIRVPLLKGLIGYRVAIVEESKRDMFTSVQSIRELKQFKAVQGPNWPDNPILKVNGIAVFEQPSWENMFMAVEKGYIDYFPRSILEAWSELETYGKNSVVDTEIIIYYPTAMYFFVSKNNPKLARRVKEGLDTLYDTGAFDEHFFNYPAHREALEKVKKHKRRIISLTNPYLPEHTPLTNSKYWLNTEALLGHSLQTVD